MNRREKANMVDNPVRFGIIGCAEIAKKVSRAINLAPNSIIYAIGSRSIEKAQKFATENGLSETVKIYGSYEEVLEDPCVDAVYMPLPTTLHVQWAVLAAQTKKHLLLEKPTALKVADLNQILNACESNGVQFMDGSMWMHHPRTKKMKEMLSDPKLFGQLRLIHSTSTFSETQEFFENNIRVKPDLDALGALGDTSWYCIMAILWAVNYQLPKTVTALPFPTCNSDGVILACGASFQWGEQDIKIATFYCSFLSNVSMDLAVYGSNGSLHLKDFIIPYQENSASFDFSSGAKFTELHLGWNLKPTQVQVASELPQEALMVQEFATLVNSIRSSGCKPDRKWPEISRKTQLVLDAVMKSIELGFKPVDL
ncbi:uncharacterized oxidoreductase At4g09670-like [Telopea speciosissima]|uniref:uncharacterized oxidoreductase At4g09670-like n=1 Tax=Telopea speciosissima TaxID=54955 RepID=UPI001CC7D9E0|nr:uncharacterized oxidoreductase At4g09670-like [Telopea speciosissima]